MNRLFTIRWALGLTLGVGLLLMAAAPDTDETVWKIGLVVACSVPMAVLAYYISGFVGSIFAGWKDR